MNKHVKYILLMAGSVGVGFTASLFIPYFLALSISFVGGAAAAHYSYIAKRRRTLVMERRIRKAVQKVLFGRNNK